MRSSRHTNVSPPSGQWRPMTAPALDAELGELVRTVQALHARTGARLASVPDWAPGLHRVSLARAVQGSASLSGYLVSLDDALAVVDDEEPSGTTEEARTALLGCRDGLGCVLQMAMEEDLELSPSLIRSLHYTLLRADRRASPGRWRHGSLPAPATGQPAGTPAETPAAAVSEVAAITEATVAPAPVLAAVVHLNLMLVSPFAVGNGRVARCVHQMLVARDRSALGVLGGIDEQLARHRDTYAGLLEAEAEEAVTRHGRGSAWVEMCLRAHLDQAKLLVARMDEAERGWAVTRELVDRAGVPLRSVSALWDAAAGLRIRNGSYRAAVTTWTGESLSYQSASRDLKTLVDAGLLRPHGETRSRWYSAADALLDAHTREGSRRRAMS